MSRSLLLLTSTGTTMAALLILIAAVNLTELVNSCTPSDLSALLSLKSSLTDPNNLGIFDSWTAAGSDCCHNNWYGIGCDPTTNRVVHLSLHAHDPSSIFPPSDASLFLSGSISPQICSLTALTTLVLADWKGISGPIPPCVASDLTSLRVLDLIGNRISGSIPYGIGNLNNLAVLNLADNQISGEIPTSIVDLAGLMHLDIRNNRISGQIPRDFGNLRMLSRALMSGNEITGSIPESVTEMDRLADLDLSMNRISGPVPVQLGKLRVISTLNLDGNLISGSIPKSLISSDINILNLSRNAIGGFVPDAFGPRSYFTALDLSYNKLRGPVPKSMTAARYIGHLDMSHNNMCGPIPAGEPFEHLEATSFDNNDCLCGWPLKAC